MTKKNTTKSAPKTTKAKSAKKATKDSELVPQNLRNQTGTSGGMSGLDAAAQVLKDSGEPMNAKIMVETMLAKGLWKTGGRTPQATIYAAIIREIAAKGDKARFQKTDRGLFTFNS